MNRAILGPGGLDDLQQELSGRDLAIVDQIAELRLMTGRQVATVFFPAEQFASAIVAVRQANRTLARLTEDRLLLRLHRRIGGIHAGSASFIYGLGPVGERLLARQGARRRYREPSARFVDHTLAVSQLITDLIVAARRGELTVLGCQPEPRCWRGFSGSGGRVVLRPDLYVAIGAGGYEHRFFVEVDRATEHLPALVRKCRLYEAYYQSGREQAAHGVAPRICWIVPDSRRAKSLRRTIGGDRRLTEALFVVTTTEHALAVLSGGPS